MIQYCISVGDAILLMAAKRVSISSSSIEGKVPFLIGVAGGTASGKVRITKKYRRIVLQFSMLRVSVLELN